MSTPALIGKKEKNGNVRFIYCHYDGYVKGGVGETLFKHYQDENKIDRLIDLGNLSSIGEIPENLSKEERKLYLYDFDKFETEVKKCVNYADLNGESVKIELVPDEDSFVEKASEYFVSYIYLFKDGDWYVKKGFGNKGDFEPVKNYL